MKDYTLKRLTVELDQLHLDPANPRLMGTKKDGPAVKGAWNDPTVQSRLLELVDQPRYELEELQSSFLEKGFLPGVQPIIVKRSPGTEEFLVLEGNRRTAALKLLQRSGQAPFSTIPVDEFVWNDACGRPEEEVIELLLGAVHVAGTKGWGAWQIAVYVHRAYSRKRRAASDSLIPFYRDDIAKEVGKLFNKKASTIKKLLLVRSAVGQLHMAGFEPTPEHYNLVDQMLTPAFSEFLGVNADNCLLAEVGVERLGQLVIAEERPISNEPLLRKFRTIVTSGASADELHQASQSREDLEDIFDLVQSRKKDQKFASDLEKIKKLIGGLRIQDFRGSQRELDLLRDVTRLTTERLPLFLKLQD
ncbi:ParB N-terminal domain-containing protein [bacterium]|nr:ParB N-terminal domain-containing protein [bacterium]